MNLIQQSKDFTQTAFEKVGKYFSHSFRVGEILEHEFDVTDPELIAAGILHDVLEDTNVTLNELSKVFPARVVSLVQELSHEKSDNYDRQSFRAHLLRISDDAKMVKLADYLDSLRWMLEIYQQGKAQKYPKFQHNAEYFSSIEQFLDTCKNGNPKEKVGETVRKLKKFI